MADTIEFSEIPEPSDSELSDVSSVSIDSSLWEAEYWGSDTRINNVDYSYFESARTMRDNHMKIVGSSVEASEESSAKSEIEDSEESLQKVDIDPKTETSIKGSYSENLKTGSAVFMSGVFLAWAVKYLTS